jgi:histidinol-phosphate/aromatic aminotransferase/cobyric acid decarboxylase-like protein
MQADSYTQTRKEFKLVDSFHCKSVAGYQSLSEVAACLGCEVTPWDVSVNEQGHFRFDVEQLEQLIRPTTRCVIVNFPHNPTGRILITHCHMQLEDQMQ